MPPVPLEFSVSPTQYDYYAWLLGFGLWLLILVIIGLTYWYLKDRHFDDEQVRQLNAIRPQLADGGWKSLVIHEDDDFAAYVDEVRSLFDGEPSQTTLWDLLSDIRAQWKHRTAGAPTLALRLVYEGVLLALLALLTTLPTLHLTSRGGSEVTTADLIHLGGWLWSLFPYSDTITVLVIGGGAVFAHLAISFWWLLAALLIGGGAILLVLDEMTGESLEVRLYRRKRDLVIWPVAFLLGVWAVGAGVNALGGALVTTAGIEGTVAASDITALSLLLAGGVFTVGVMYAGADLAGRLVEHQNQPENATSAVAAYLLARKTCGLLGVLALPVLAGYAVQSVTGGGVATLVELVATAPSQTQGLLLLAALSVLLAVSYVYEERAREWYRAFQRAISSRAVRSRAFIQLVLGRAATLFTFIGVLLGSMPFLGGLIPALVAALVAAAGVRFAILAWVRIKYRYKDRIDPRGSGVRDVLVEGRTLTDADGETIFVTRVDGTPHAHRDPETLVERTLQAAESRLDHGDIGPSFERYYYEAVTDRGTVGLSMVADEFRGDIKSRLEGTFADNDGEVGVESLDDEMTDKYPEPAYRRTIAYLRKNGKVDVRNGYYRWHE